MRSEIYRVQCCIKAFIFAEFMIKIFGYVRESTVQQAFFGYNIEEQKRVITEYCKYHYQDYELEIFTEMGKSARSLNRPELQNLLDTVKKAKADKVVFHSLDRLTRDIKDLYMLIEFFDKNKIELVSVMESLDLTTAIGRSNVFNSGVYAQLESERTSERTIRAYKQAIVEGKYPFPKSPLGYDKIDKKLYPSKDLQQIEIINFIFDNASSNTLNYVELSEEIRKRYSYFIKDDTIREIVQSKLYTGVMEYRGIVNEEYCEPLVSKEKSEQARKYCKAKRRSHWKANYVFKNKAFCSNCEQQMTQTSAKGKYKKIYSYYRCPNCGKLASEDRLIKNNRVDLQRITNEYFKDDSGIEEKRKKVEKLKSSQKKLVESVKKDVIDVDTFYDVFIHYDEEINELEKQIEQIKLKINPFDTLSVPFRNEIVNKYIKELQVVFTPKSYHSRIVFL